jgi:hypothetical protein
VYGKVIDAVCEQSQVDFEEGGIDQGTLELLKSVRHLHTFDPLLGLPPELQSYLPAPFYSISVNNILGTKGREE